MTPPPSSLLSIRAATLAGAIGNTPLVELPRFSSGGARIFAKLEWFNPGGSVKDRVAAAMLDDAETRGLISPGGTIVEPTSGNTGVAFAMLAAVKGYRCVVVMPDGAGHVKARLMEAFGAEVVRTPAADRMSGAIQRARDLVAQTPGSWLPNQFANPINPRTHYETTGPEIWEALGGRVDAWVTGVGTTGTFTGVGRYLAEQNPRVLKVAVEPQGSILGGGERGTHAVEGVGLSFYPEILDRSVIDEVLMIDDATAFEACRRLAREEGLLAGGSSGLSAAGALRIAERLGPGKVVATVFPDAAERYPEQGIFQR
ncbi:MAG: cysteine synthase family protein [Acidobacteriota bacterium]